MAGRVHYPLLLMLQFFFTNLTFLSGKISGDTQGVIQHPSGAVYYLELFNLDIDTVTKHNVWSRQILEPSLVPSILWIKSNSHIVYSILLYSLQAALFLQ